MIGRLLFDVPLYVYSLQSLTVWNGVGGLRGGFVVGYGSLDKACWICVVDKGGEMGDGG